MKLKDDDISLKIFKWLKKFNKRRKLSIVAVIYIALIIVFSFFYQCAFEKNNRNFTFNSEIREIRRQMSAEDTKRVIAWEKRNIDKLNNYLILLKPILDNKNSYTKLTLGDNESKLTMPDRQYIVTSRYPLRAAILSEKPAPDPILILIIKDKTIYEKISIPDPVAELLILRKSENYDLGSALVKAPIEIPKNLNEYKKLITGFINYLEDEITVMTKYIAQREYEAISEPWSYWDFLYFSTITQTTVGYGDILPNTTYVRILVILQVLLGVIIIGFVAAYIVSSK